jgi:hypothetical protein
VEKAVVASEAEAMAMAAMAMAVMAMAAMAMAAMAMAAMAAMAEADPDCWHTNRHSGCSHAPEMKGDRVGRCGPRWPEP